MSNTETYARCENKACRLCGKVQFIPDPAVKFEDGRLATRCKCGGPLQTLSTQELRELREARNQLQDGGER